MNRWLVALLAVLLAAFLYVDYAHPFRIWLLASLALAIVLVVAWMYADARTEPDEPADDEHDLAMVAAHYELAARDLERLAADTGSPSRGALLIGAEYLRARAVGHRIAAFDADRRSAA